MTDVDQYAVTGQTKLCRGCQQILPLSAFGKNRAVKGKTTPGITHRCKACLRKYRKEHYQANKERLNAARRVKEQGRTQEQLDALWAYQLFYRYHLTVEEYDTILHKQGDKCANPGCDATEPGGNLRHWHVDHDHACCDGDRSCGKCVRGLLCRKCNSSLGILQDDVNRISGFLTYLRDSKAAFIVRMVS